MSLPPPSLKVPVVKLPVRETVSLPPCDPTNRGKAFPELEIVSTPEVPIREVPPAPVVVVYAKVLEEKKVSAE